jgi:hypothetical protein
MVLFALAVAMTIAMKLEVATYTNARNVRNVRNVKSKFQSQQTRFFMVVVLP